MNKQEYAEYLKSGHWQAVRKWALALTEYRCQLCAASTNLDVHHSNYDRLYSESPGDVVVLCRTCHKSYHHIDLPDDTEVTQEAVVFWPLIEMENGDLRKGQPFAGN